MKPGPRSIKGSVDMYVHVWDDPITIHRRLVSSCDDPKPHKHRVRPPNAREGRSALGLRTCVSVDEDGKTVRLKAAAGTSYVYPSGQSVNPETSCAISSIRLFIHSLIRSSTLPSPQALYLRPFRGPRRRPGNALPAGGQAGDARLHARLQRHGLLLRPGKEKKRQTHKKDCTHTWTITD